MNARREPVPGIRRFFPIPLVGVAALLIVLILFTPILFATGPAAPGTFETQALLIVDRPSPSGPTNFYVRAEGETVRYTAISIANASGFAWTGNCPAALRWTFQNSSNAVAANLSSSGLTVAVNVTATYTVGASTAIYAAVIAFEVSGSNLVSVVCFGASVPGSLPLASLPVAVVLTDYGSGGPP
ncbi:MAG TPA: hypothetical protein VMG36_01980 [Thermoplasmata archaeon]|nr:hypothetical protein [Thermoplasmata archaeon]